jgi:hypothetical protein
MTKMTYHIVVFVACIADILKSHSRNFIKSNTTEMLFTLGDLDRFEMLNFVIITVYYLYGFRRPIDFVPTNTELFLLFLLCFGFDFVYPAFATDNFPISSSITSLSTSASAATTTTQAPAQILQLNTACLTLSSFLSACTSATAQFTALSPTQQAFCLCYESTIFYKPSLFDGAVKTCADYASTACPVAYPPIAGLLSFCAVVGPVAMPTGFVGTGNISTSSITTTLEACNLISAYLGSCQQGTPGFLTMHSTDQASCLCYTSSSWAPSSFDNAVSSCEVAAKDQNTGVWGAVVSLDGFCGDIGDILPSSNLGPVNTSPGVITAVPTSQQPIGGTTSTDVTISITIGNIQPTVGGVVPVGSDAGFEKVSKGEVVGISAVCAAALLFLC